MGEFVSISSAAKALGVSDRRVRELAQSGDIRAQKVGRAWVVDSDSVEERLRRSPSAGRPAFGEKDRSKIREYTLMCRNDEVLDFAFSDSDRTNIRITVRNAPELSPVGTCAGFANPTELNLSGWIRDRYIPSSRIGVAGLLHRAGCSDTSALMFKTFGLNLTDQYWFRPKGVTLNWKDINFFDNPYEGDKDATGPGSGTPGMLEKWWELRDGRSYLVKASSMGEREPFAEVLATRMLERILRPGEYVPYELERVGGKPHSVCPSFVEKNEQLVTLKDVFTCFAKPVSEPYDYGTYVRVCRQLGLEEIETALSKLIVCDYLDANLDRHDMNLGLVRDVDTLEFTRVAPVFDNGRSFFFDAQRKEDLASGQYFHASHPFSEYPSAQLALVNDYSWFDESSLYGFGDVIRETLAENELLPEWFPGKAAEQFERQLERVVEMKRERAR